MKDQVFTLEFMGVISGRKGYVHGLKVSGLEEDVVSFEKWLLDTLHNGFRSQSRIRKPAFHSKDGKVLRPATVSTMLAFKDRGKLAFVKLVYHPT